MRATLFLPWLLSTACAPPEAQRYLAWQVDGDGYVVAPRDKGSLRDLSAVSGSMGTVYQGGSISIDNDGTTAYHGGRAMRVVYGVDGDVAVPTDEQGLLLWSFVGHLEDLSTELGGHGFDPEVFFPIDATWSPVIPDLTLEMLPMENAAYATAGHFFILLNDLIDKDIPLAANAGIVRHEFGHAAFHWLTTGDVLGDTPFDAVTQDAASLYYSSLHEAYADSFAALTLDDPDFFEGSLDMPDRDMTGDHQLEEVELPEDFLAESSDDPLAIWDPYPLGTVFASTAWDTREALGDPGEALAILTDAVLSWTQDGRFGDAWGLLEHWVDVAPQGEAQSALCQAIGERFGDAYTPDACGGGR